MLVGQSYRYLETTLSEQAEVDQIVRFLEVLGVGLDPFVNVVHAFGNAVGESVVEPSQNIVQTLEQPPCDIDHLRNVRGFDAIIPSEEQGASCPLVRCFEEAAELLLEIECSGKLRVEKADLIYSCSVPLIMIGFAVQDSVFDVLGIIQTACLQFAIGAFPHFVDGFVDHLDYVEAIQDRFGFRKVFFHACFVFGRHIHRDQAYRIDIASAGCDVIADRLHGIGIMAEDAAYKPVILICDHSDVIVAARALNLIHEQCGDIREIALSLAFFHDIWMISDTIPSPILQDSEVVLTV